MIGVADAKQITEPLIKLEIKPQLCVLATKEEECTDQLLLHWTASELQSVCLFGQENQDALHCWVSQKEGEFSVIMRTRNSKEFELKDLAHQVSLAKATYKVLVEYKGSSKLKRNPWSFF